MDLEFTSEQQELRAAVRRFLDERAPLAWVRERIGDDRGTTDEVWRGLAGIGAVGLLAPETVGGSGGGMVDAGVVLEELGRAAHPGPYLSSAVGAVSAASLCGDDLLASELAAGTTVGAVVLGGRGERHEHVADAGAADVVIVCDDSGVWVVERGDSGLTVTPAQTVDVTRREATVEVAADAGRRIGDGPCTAAVRDRLVAGAVVDGVGAADAAFQLAVAYAKERVQFDKPIGSFQAVQHLLADMLQWLELSRAGAYYALWACDAADAGERRRAASIAKSYAADSLWRVGAQAIQVLGGIGFTWEHDAHLFYKRLLTLQQSFGRPSDHLDELATLVF